MTMLWLFLQFFFLPIIRAETYSCPGNLSTKETGPKFPGIPGNFQTVIEANIVNKNYTIVTREYFNINSMKGSLFQVANGNMYRVLYNKNNLEILYLKVDEFSSTCVVGNLTTLKGGLFNAKNPLGNIPIFTTEAAINMSQRGTGPIYQGTTIVRGLPVNYWISCSYLPTLNSNFTIHYYFEDTTWKTSTSAKGMPVRFIVSGVTVTSNGSNHNFHHVYDYFSFNDQQTGNYEDVFEVPKGCYCPGRKSAKMIPKPSTHFSYKQELVLQEYNRVELSNVWYDYDYRMIRIDYQPDSGVSKYPLMEIHDYNSGLRYIKDKVLGNCSVYPLLNTTLDSLENMTLWKHNKSYILRLKNALQYFYMDTNFEYEGQRLARNVKCDVFIGKHRKFRSNDGQETNVTLEYYFLSDNYVQVPGRGYNISTRIPVMLHATAEQGDYFEILNFVDFSDDRPDITTYDIESCYSNQAKMHLTVRLSGNFYQSAREFIISEGIRTLATSMKINPLRVQDVRVTYDNNELFLFAIILDRSPASAQFTLIANNGFEVADDKVVSNIDSLSTCAQMCVQESTFVCNSFQMCSFDKTCRLSRHHINDGTIKVKKNVCNLFSRTVNGPKVVEPNLTTSLKKLKDAIEAGGFILNVIDTMTGNHLEYKAVDFTMNLGYLTEVKMPSIPTNFYYQEEVTIPSDTKINTAEVFYDMEKKLIRYDCHGSTCSSITYFNSPTKVVHDFQAGVSYVIDKHHGNCTITNLTSSKFDVQKQKGSGIGDKTYILQMKNPFQLFHLDSTYRLAGQQTVRGLKCNVFESLRTDFSTEISQPGDTFLFQFYFLSEDMTDNIDSKSVGVPVRLDISGVGLAYYTTYNFFEFFEREPNANVFDVTRCFPDNNKVVFQLQFSGNFKSDLSNHRYEFIDAVIKRLVKVSQVSAFRFQSAMVDNTATEIIFIVTLLDPPPAIAKFTKIPGASGIYKNDVSLLNINDPQTCAQACINAANFTCNAFNYCSVRKLCQLSRHHINDGSQLSSKPVCDLYSRNTNASNVSIQKTSEAIKYIKTFVYTKKFVVTTTTNSGKNKKFIAHSIVLNVDRSNSRNIVTAQNLKNYQLLKNDFRLKPRYTNAMYSKVSVDDCANYCTKQTTFDCRSFSFCFVTEDCFLSKQQPAGANLSVSSRKLFCDIYSRNYLHEYKKLSGKFILAKSDKDIADTTNAESCAQYCSKETDFHCKSFEFCSYLSICKLGKTSTMDTPSKDITTSPICDAYSRNYLDNFQLAYIRVEQFTNNLLIKNLSLQQCAENCIEEEGFKCVHFDYCPISNICRLTGKEEESTGIVSASTSGNCSHYIRTYYPHNPIAKPIQKVDKQTGKKVGLAFGVLIVSFVLGIVIIKFVHNRSRVNKQRTQSKMLVLEEQ